MPHFFRSSGYLEDDPVVCGDGSVLSVADLPPFLRTLMVADGTVTKSLEAWFWEPVKVSPLHQKRLLLEASLPLLEVEAGAEVLQREVCLTGRTTGRDYACARSLLLLSALPAGMREGMLEGRIGIGELLREQGVETYREIVDLGYLSAGERRDALLARFEGDLVSRAYRIRVAGEPAILVSEFFPLAVYRG